MSYLEYLNNPTLENIRLVYKQSRLTQPEISDITKLKLGSVKNWTRRDQEKRTTPSLQSWNLLMYELESRRIGYSNLSDFFKNHSNAQE